MFYHLKSSCEASVSVDVLFCKRRSGSTVPVLSALTRAPWSLLPSKRSHMQLDRSEAWRQTANVPCLRHASFLHIYLVPARRQRMLQWRRGLITCLWMKLDFSQNKHNVTMMSRWLYYPSPISQYLYRSREEGLKNGQTSVKTWWEMLELKVLNDNIVKACPVLCWFRTKTNDCLFCIPVSDGSTACKRRENPEGEDRSICIIMVYKWWWSSEA